MKKELIEKLQNLSEAERNEFINNELTLEEIIELNEKYGFEIELSNGNVTDACFESEQENNSETTADGKRKEKKN